MKTLMVDDYQRVRLPNVKPRSKLDYEEVNGKITLTPRVRAAGVRAGRLARDVRTGLFFWKGDITDAEAEDAALSANLERE